MVRRFCILLLLLALSGTCQATVALHDWEPSGEFGGRTVTRDENYIYAFAYGEMSFGYEPPYQTSVYDRQENLLFTIDAYFKEYWDENSETERSGLEDGYGVVEFSDGSYGIVSDAGEVLIDGLRSARGFYGEYAYYGRDFGEPLLDKLAQKLGLGIGICGRIDRDGRRFEVMGWDMHAPDEQGYYLVQTRKSYSPGKDRFGYLDAEGKWAVLPVYTDAYPFMEGAAVVQRDGVYFLIDPQGNQIGDFEWEWDVSFYERSMFTFPLVPVGEEGGYRLYDRRGSVANEELFELVCKIVADDSYLLCKGFDDHLNAVDADGKIIWRGVAQNVSWGSDQDCVWLLEDGLWREVDFVKLDYTGRTRSGEDW